MSTKGSKHASSRPPGLVSEAACTPCPGEREEQDDAQPSDLTWYVAAQRDELRSLAPAWDALCGPTAQTMSPAWVLSWFETLGQGAQPYVLAAQDHTGQLCAVLPLARMPGGSAQLPGGDCGGAHGDVMVRGGFERAARHGLRDLLVSPPLRRLRLRRLAVDGVLPYLLSRSTMPGFGKPRLCAAAPAIVGFETWEAFLAQLSKRRRHEIRRQLRRFHEVPGARVQWVTDPEAVEPALDTLFRLHAARFASQRRSTVFRGAALMTFHQHLARRLLEDGNLLLGRLEAEGRTIAVAYGWHRRGRTTLFQMGIDPGAQALAPGIVLAALVLREQVIGANRDALDLGEGCYPWKLAWANEVRHLVDVDAYGRGALGRAQRLGGSAIRALRSLVGARLHERGCHGQSTSSAAPALTRCRRAGCVRRQG